MIMATKEGGQGRCVHRPITTCSMTIPSEHLGGSSRFFKLTNQSEDVRTRNAKLFCNCASGASLSPEPRHTTSVRIDTPGPAKPDSTRLRAGNTGVNALTDDLVFELSHSAKNVHLKPRRRVRPGRVDTLLRHDERDVVGRELSDHTGKVRETAPEPVEFVTDDDIDLSTPHRSH
jgi:hypothetical protein